MLPSRLLMQHRPAGKQGPLDLVSLPGCLEFIKQRLFFLYQSTIMCLDFPKFPFPFPESQE